MKWKRKASLKTKKQKRNQNRTQGVTGAFIKMLCYNTDMIRKLIVGFLVFVLLVPPMHAGAETDAERRKRLETELQNVERQILTQQRLVEDKQQERQSLERDIAIINSEITQAQLGIQARAVAIEQLSGQIGDKEVVLDILSEKLNRQQD